MPPSRILVYGVTGSGKTTLARELSQKTGIPLHEVDDLAFNANWEAVPLEVQRARIATICAGEAWILDSAYAMWLDLATERLELMVGLDYPRWFSFARLVARTFSRVVDKKPVCNGNVETWRNLFSKDSILLWHFRSFKKKRERIHRFASDGPFRVRILRNHREAVAFLGEWEKPPETGNSSMLEP